jgi:ADP-dependent phosphofructokinase/glucokinase
MKMFDKDKFRDEVRNEVPIFREALSEFMEQYFEKKNIAILGAVGVIVPTLIDLLLFVIHEVPINKEGKRELFEQALKGAKKLYDEYESNNKEG